MKILLIMRHRKIDRSLLMRSLLIIQVFMISSNSRVPGVTIVAIFILEMSMNIVIN